ncbi:acylphosphatase [Desulfocurvibacter africanus]|uniref:acylphosphatase n=1 Tax=Desulfocurvibacter africanus TaxID=873 RepID=UPI002FDAE27C
MSQGPKTIRCLVSGLVQGVSFRYWTRETATRLGLRGWVRNLSDGRVEVLVQGAEEATESLRQALHDGPPMSQVQAVECFKEPNSEEFNGFVIRR